MNPAPPQPDEEAKKLGNETLPASDQTHQETGHAQEQAENIKNQAWFDTLSKALGSTQLSHALAKLESLERIANAAHQQPAQEKRCEYCGAPKGLHYPTCWRRESDLALALPADNIIGSPGGKPASLEWYAEKFSYKCGYPLFAEMLRNYAAVRRGWQPTQKPQEFTWKVDDRLRKPGEGNHWWWTVREIVDRGLVITAMNGNGHRHLIDWHAVAKCQNLNASTQARCADSEDTKRLDWIQYELKKNGHFNILNLRNIPLREAIDAAIRSQNEQT